MSTPSVLLVDDNEDIQYYLMRICELEGYEVYQAHSGAEALDVLRARGGPVSLILLDVMMPVMDGPTFLSILKSDPQYREFISPVIVLSASRENVPTGIAGFLAKPVDLSDVVAALERFRPSSHSC